MNFNASVKLLVFATFGLILTACSSEFADFYSLAKIDAHAHIRTYNPAVIKLAEKNNFKWFSITTHSESQQYIDEQLNYAMEQKRNFPDDFSFTTAFSMEGFGEPGCVTGIILLPIN
jgi:hypothetical protein